MFGRKSGPICRAFSSVSFPPTLSAGGLAHLSLRTLRRHPLQSNHNFNKTFVAVRNAQSDQSFSREGGGDVSSELAINGPPCKHVLAPLPRSETMWHKVTCLATDRRQQSSSRLSAFPKCEFGKWERRCDGDAETGVGGVTCPEMSAVVAKTCGPSIPPPPGRGASLRFAIS